MKNILSQFFEETVYLKSKNYLKGCRLLGSPAFEIGEYQFSNQQFNHDNNIRYNIFNGVCDIEVNEKRTIHYQLTMNIHLELAFIIDDSKLPHKIMINPASIDQLLKYPQYVNKLAQLMRFLILTIGDIQSIMTTQNGYEFTSYEVEKAYKTSSVLSENYIFPPLLPIATIWIIQGMAYMFKFTEFYLFYKNNTKD